MFSEIPERITINGHEATVGSCEIKDGILLITTKKFKVDENAEKINAENVSISDINSGKDAIHVDRNTHKIPATGKEIDLDATVKNKAGEVLRKGLDYNILKYHGTIKEPGVYDLEIQGMCDYRSHASIRMIVTPEPVTGVKVRQTTATGGYDDAYVTWSAAEGADGYQVYARRPSRTKDWTYLGRTTERSFLEKDLYDGYKYEFKVIPYKLLDGTRFRTTEDYETVSMYTMKKVSTPVVKKYSSSRVRVSWNNISGESGYQLRASRTGKTTYFRTSGTSYRFSVAKGKKYTYKVRAYKNVTKNGKTYRVYGPWSNERTYTLR